MISVNGIYENGVVRIDIDKRIQAKKTIKVIVTFLDEEYHNDSKHLTTKDFSFSRSREKSKRYKGSISDAVVEDRRVEL